MKIEPFEMERWQSEWEHRVAYNLSESGVHPLTLGELVEPGLVEALLATPLGYVQTDGTDRLKRAICALYPGSRPENILVTTGSSEANFLLLWSLLEPGDRALVERPNFMQVEGLARSLGAGVEVFELEERLGWQPDLDRLAGTSHRIVALSNPNNPTGARLGQEARAALVELCESSGAWLLADEVYQGAELDGELTPTLWGASERVIVTGGLSKAYGLPGLRVGWIVAPASVVERIWPYHDYTTIALNALSDRIAPAALTEPTRTRVLERTRGIIRENLTVLESWRAGHGGLFEWIAPEAGAIVFARHHLDVPSAELARRLRDDHDVLLVPGDQFRFEGYVRFGIGGPRGELERALARVSRGVEEFGR
jgi:aspartate/methionine/tyrosine aminotransferase